ncbi:MAG: hypothetical protein HY534_03790 [Chloroflexi bacterium]|nr:hypothetical protein [Chloroflexota bacterium]
MEPMVQLLRVVHILAAIMMAWPAYALVVVNQRALLGPPLGDRADLYLEQTVRSRVVPCYVFQATVLISGLALVLFRGLGWDTLITNPVLGLKFLLLLLVVAFLSIVNFGIQPRIDALFAAHAGQLVGEPDAGTVRSLRTRRKRMASLCLFGVLTAAMLGAQVAVAFPFWLTLSLAALIAAFTWRSYASPTAWGWV